MTKYVPSCVVAARADAMQPSDVTRVASILRSGALDHHGPELDVLVAEAAHVMGMDVAALTVVLHERQEMVATAGIDPITMPREEWLCTHVVASGELLIISDAHRDPFFANHPAVAGDLAVRSYCGYPIRTEDGEVLGALCVFGADPRTFDQVQLEAFVAITQSARRALLPGAPPMRLPLAPDAATTPVDPLAAWIERSLPSLVDDQGASRRNPRRRRVAHWHRRLTNVG